MAKDATTKTRSIVRETKGTPKGSIPETRQTSRRSRRATSRHTPGIIAPHPRLIHSRGLYFTPAPIIVALAHSGETFASIARTLDEDASHVRQTVFGRYPTSKLLPRICEALGLSPAVCWLSQKTPRR